MTQTLEGGTAIGASIPAATTFAAELETTVSEADLVIPNDGCDDQHDEQAEAAVSEPSLVLSGSLWGTERDLLARAQVFQRVFGSWAPIVRAAFYFKNYGKTNGLKNFKKFVRGKI